ncbi:MAG TPA: electron transfer flavoprotein beta subunit/FixA family protein, partial [Myxococcota bacterium]|nr:electron transfer flavoprotein beta subunit/FixA family protein [Myxococcota bacterium]
MKIAVCVKHVPEGLSRLDSQTFRLDRSGEGALNHFDANAVEEALRLKGDSDTEVVAVSLGP